MDTARSPMNTPVKQYSRSETMSFTARRRWFLWIISAIIISLLIITTGIILKMFVFIKHQDLLSTSTTIITDISSEDTTVITHTTTVTTMTTTITTTTTTTINQCTRNYSIIKSYPHRAWVVSMVSADINSDGHKDIIVLERISGVIEIFLNNNNDYKTFTIQTISYSNDSFPNAMTLSDINNDKKLDIIITDDVKLLIIIFINVDNRYFIEYSRYPTEGSPINVLTADINNDNITEIILINSYSGIRIVYINPNDPEEFNSQTINFQDDYATSITLVDANNDNSIDLLITLMFETSVVIFYNDGQGNFTNGINVSSSKTPNTVTTGYINDDPYLDLIVTYDLGHGIGTFFNDGNGTFINSTIYLTNMPTRMVAIGDINKDNKNDIVVSVSGSRNSTSTIIFFNNGHGSFTNRTIYSTEFDGFSVAIDDVNIIIAHARSVGILYVNCHE